ncbi:hypothetical protein SE15_09285 [Thermanaerothrix daxensis]|uniref:Lipoprotein n=1 Tax=Thermanaerothrix daxensis TaxID=869279 RepID=A0A0N8GQ06_9CHLR|nr:hypothetical protein [Thermanaerothrix daxensis]KPL82362.1 hypothetical protein SE15_09285 [Thermanaerothrix daxensis]
MRPTHLLRLFVLILANILISACQSEKNPCQSAGEPPSYLTALPTPMPPTTPTPGPSPTPILVKIGGKMVVVDKVVEGPLCNDTWSGTVYVSCKVQVMAWERSPTFLKGCNLTIAPGTVVYVAAHHDAAYYNGCSCHTGEINNP